MNNYQLKLVIIIALLPIGFTDPCYAQSVKTIPLKNSPALKIEDRTIIDIVLKIEAPFSVAVLTIENNGTASYVAQQYDQIKFQDSGTLTESQMNTLTKSLEDANFLRMTNRPQSADDPLDGSTYTITVRSLPAGSPPELAYPGTDSVNCYEFSCEEKFLGLKKQIIEFWGKNILETGI